ncbi:CoA-acylating methylmalonate-semialdehyde dehydrogenase [Novosphingobium sp. 1949]|uniref:CoA-acylating methylmalonate-semialdehyde dehydrogenase n=1 Tax=Novosphingobium organovorum TaxID=2930092 RepID=A0ABT0BBA3_9SPHN|nr:CoA-acylating methylmalonate-semialdehyde dehydrogenase [Novosphingobium organovorum]MCJ2182160.1 CoA-acylating methylmalonate-semialdehyde dehydrogenase [Novosphingobium organovorum]
MRRIRNFIGGKSAPSNGPSSPVFDPAKGTVAAVVEHADAAVLEQAIARARAAQPAWAALNPQRRARVLFRFKALIEESMEELAGMISAEHGKVLDDACGDVQRGLEVIEFVCGLPHLAKGDFTLGAGTDIDVYSMRQPMGVVAGITPFNFPAMIPLWMAGPALATGNAFVLKPSERTPSTAVRLAELFIAAGGPADIFAVVHGGKPVVDALLDHPDVRAVSFVGSSDIAAQVYARGAAVGKRVQAMGGAKNHGIVLPDADLDQAVSGILGAAYGSAGERCMALPVVVAVGDALADALRDRLIAGIAGLTVGVPTDPVADFGPLVSAQHKARIEDYIDLAVAEGSQLVRDGRGIVVPGHENGYFLGPTLLDHVRADMRSYQEEIFGPVLQIVRVNTLDEAIALASDHSFGNGVALFTSSGSAARAFASRVEIGMVGINVPIPVPVAYHSFGGWKRSAFGDVNQYGEEGLRFFTRTKVVTQRWPEHGGVADPAAAFVIPTMD